MGIDEMFDENNRDQEQIYGVVIGIVTNNKDERLLGRIQIRFPWRSEEQKKAYWARIGSLMAGKGRGTVFYPEVGDEVLVAFEHGDINHPYILGTLWNGRDPPPEKNENGQNNIRVIHSRSGHEIILDDTTGNEKIVLVDKTRQNKVTIDSAQNEIRIEAAIQIRITAPNIEIQGSESLTIGANGCIAIQGQIVKIN
ncbi:MAG: hypothetical protein APR53_02850 [Methanoculleus sp. SDB]|nr:MAG: hypothetical protein APR53_02850 [Methanoculleus sp. SDB]